MQSIKNTITIFLQRPFVHGSLVLQAGSFFSTGVGIVSSVLIARLLGVSSYGDYAILSAFVGIISLFSDWGADGGALVKVGEHYARSDKEGIAKTMAAYGKLTLISTVGIGVFFICIVPIIARYYYGRDDIGHYAQWWLAANVVMTGGSFAVLALSVQREMRKLVIFESASEIIKSLGKLSFLAAGFGLMGVMTGYFAGSLAVGIGGLFLYRGLARRDDLFPRVRDLFRTVMKAPLSQFLKFSFGIGLGKNIGNILSFIPLLYLGRFSLPAEAGFYKIAFSYTTLSFVLLSGVSRFMGIQFPQTRVAGITVLRSQFLKTGMIAGLLNALMLAALILAGPWLIAMVYGETYRIAGRLVWPIALALFPTGFTIGFGSVYRALDRVYVPTVLGVLIVAAAALFCYMFFWGLTPLRFLLVFITVWNWLGLAVQGLLLAYYFHKEALRERATINPA